MLTLISNALAVAVALSTPCADESSNNCYWDAQTFGNSVGYSYVALEAGDKVCITYLVPNGPDGPDDYCEDL